MKAVDSSRAYDVVVVGGGPAGATAAHDLALKGHSVLLLDRAGRIKPCGGAIPPRLIKDFAIPEHLLVARARSARMISPKDVKVDIPIENGFVGLVDREHFDEWLRERAASAGAVRRNGMFERIERTDDGLSVVHFRAQLDDDPQATQHANQLGTEPAAPRKGKAATVAATVLTRCVIGADGARSEVARQNVPGAEKLECVFAYHEIIRAPANPPPGYDGTRCDVIYRGTVSPDFYGWVFPHGDTMSVGTGSADKGFSLRTATAELRKASGLEGLETLRREGAPLPMKPLKCWDNGRDVVLAGDAAGVVAPSSGEGIYYAMYGGRLAADAAVAYLKSGNPQALAQARKQFMKAHGKVFLVLGLMQRFWYSSDKRRERFVKICMDKDVQQLTFESYMNKELVRKKPMAHVRIFFKDMAHLLGLVRV
jgi:geranylgeranyl diphosphate/geranylgeranyl-bacteriochlorophyllide a reductase